MMFIQMSFMLLNKVKLFLNQIDFLHEALLLGNLVVLVGSGSLDFALFDLLLQLLDLADLLCQILREI